MIRGLVFGTKYEAGDAIFWASCSDYWTFVHPAEIKSASRASSRIAGRISA